MAQEDAIILKVGTEEAVKSVNDLKDNIKLLKTSLGDLEIGTQEYQNTLDELKVNQNALKDAMYATSTSMEDVAKAATGASESYNSLVHRMAALKEEWRATNDQARRNELGEQIAQVNQQLKGMDASIGNFQRNVGNYSSALDGLREGFLATAGGAGAVINPVKNVTLGFKALSATPVIGILGLLANILSKVIANLDSSETNANRLKVALAPLSAGANLVTKAFQFLGEKLADVATWVTKVLDKFGLINEESKKHKKIAEDEIALVERRREVEMANADAQLEIAKLKAQAAEKDKYTASERLKFIEEAAQKEREIADRNIELARKEYEVLQEKAALAENSKEENEALADAYVKLQNAETDYFNKSKELNAQRVEAINAIKAEEDALDKLNKKKMESVNINAIVKDADKETTDLNKQLLSDQKEFAQEIEDEWEAVNADIEEYLAEEERLKDEAAKKEKERQDAKVSSMYAVADATSSILSSIADMYEADEESAKKNAKKVKALRIVSATIDMLNGAIGAFTQASSTLPPPFGQIVGAANAAAVITMGTMNINKIKNSNFDSANGGSTSASLPSASVSAPSVSTNVPNIRNVTSSSEEDRLNRMAEPQKVYILQSDIEASSNQSKVQVAESSF